MQKLNKLVAAVAFSLAIAFAPASYAKSTSSGGSRSSSSSSGSRSSSGSSGSKSSSWGSGSKSSGSSSSGSSGNKSSSWGSGSSGSSKTGSSSSGSSGSTGSNKSSSWGSGSTSTKTDSSSSWGSSSSAKRSKNLSPADEALYSKAKAQGTTFKSRDEAATTFKQKYATQYTAKFASEPKTRPTYIPATYSNGGVTYNVTYNQSMGGYGYYGAGGAWIMYDAMRDAAMMSMLMSNHGYYYGAAPVYDASVGVVLLWVFVIVILVVVGGMVVIGLAKGSS